MRSTRWSRKSIMSKSPYDCTDNVRKTIWEGALEEAGRGWLEGQKSLASWDLVL